MTPTCAFLAAMLVPFGSRTLPEQLALVVHILAGSLAILSGFVALSVTKGSPVHRRVGMLFVFTMLPMSLLGATIAGAWSRAAFVNVPAGVLTAYLVMTSLMTVRTPGEVPTSDSWLGSQYLSRGLMVLALVVGSTELVWGVQAVTSESGTRFGFPAFPFFLFAGVGLVGGIGDLRVIRSGALQGAPRLARHLWRMTFALFIAAMSFFIGQAKVFPKPIRIYPLLVIPPLVVLGALVYWLWRVRLKRSLRGIRVAAATAQTGG